MVRCQMAMFARIPMSEVIDKINESAFIIHSWTSSKNEFPNIVSLPAGQKCVVPCKTLVNYLEN